MRGPQQHESPRHFVPHLHTWDVTPVACAVDKDAAEAGRAATSAITIALAMSRRDRASILIARCSIVTCGDLRRVRNRGEYIPSAGIILRNLGTGVKRGTPAGSDPMIDASFLISITLIERLLQFAHVENRPIRKQGHPPSLGFQPIKRKVCDRPDKLWLEGEYQASTMPTILDEGLKTVNRRLVNM